MTHFIYRSSMFAQEETTVYLQCFFCNIQRTRTMTCINTYDTKYFIPILRT